MFEYEGCSFRFCFNENMRKTWQNIVKNLKENTSSFQLFTCNVNPLSGTVQLKKIVCQCESKVQGNM